MDRRRDRGRGRTHELLKQPRTHDKQDTVKQKGVGTGRDHTVERGKGQQWQQQ
jgi:hypothetical protein